MAKKNLPLSDKDFYDGSGNPLKDVAKSIEILKKLIEDTTKSLIDFNTAKLAALRANPKDSSKDFQDVSKGLDDVTKNTQALIQVKKEKERLDIAAIKYAKEEQLANEKLKLENQKQKKAVVELAKEQKGLIDDYDRLKKKTNEAQREFKKLAVEFGVNSKQAKAAKVEFDKLDDQLRNVNDAAKDGRRDVGRYEKAWGGLKGVISSGLGLLGITAGFATLKKVFTDVTMSTQTTGDAWTATVTGMKFSYDKLITSFASGDGWTNLLENIKESYKAGKEYAALLDDLFERTQSYNIARAEANVLVAEQERITKDVTKADDERRKAVIEIDRIETELLQKNIDLQQKSYDAAFFAVNEKTKLSKEEFETFLKNYADEEDLRNKSADYIEKENKLLKERTNLEKAIETARQQGWTTNNYIPQLEEITQKQSDLVASYGDSANAVVAYSAVFRKYNKSTDEIVGKAVESLVNLKKAQDDYYANTRKNYILGQKLEEDIKKAAEEKAKKDKELADSQINNLENLRKKVSDLQKEREKMNLSDLESIRLKDVEIANAQTEIKNIEFLIKYYNELQEAKIKANEPLESVSPISAPTATGEIKTFDNTKYDETLKAEQAKFDALKSINESGYSSIFDIFSKWATKKKAKEENMSADEIQALEKTNQAKVQAVEELVNTLISIYTELLDSRIQDLETEINATNQKINETEQALNRETSLQEQGAANNVAIEKQKLERLQQERDKDLQEQKKLQKERDKVNKLTQISSLITAIANIINQYSNQGPQGWILGLLAASAAVIGYISASGEAESAVGEEGELLTKKGTYLESGKRHSRGGNKYSSAEFEEGEAHAIFSRDATRRNYKDIKQFTDLVNSGKWDLYKSQIGGNLNSIIVNNDYEKLLNEQRKTNQILQNQIRPVYNNKGKLVKFNINGVMIKAEI